MRLASCPRCGKPNETLHDGQDRLVSAVSAYDTANNSGRVLGKQKRCGPGAEMPVRSGGALSLIEQHDEWLRQCGWYDIVSGAGRELDGRG